MFLLGRKGSNLRFGVQSAVPYHLATPQKLSVRISNSTHLVTTSHRRENIGDSARVQQHLAGKIQKSHNKKCHAEWTRKARTYKAKRDGGQVVS